MRNISRGSLPVAIMALVLLCGGAWLAAAQHQYPHQTTQFVGDKGEVTFTTDTRVAGLTLKPGRYYIDHRVEGTINPRRVAGHYIHFTEVTPESQQRHQAARNALGGAVVAHPGEIECTLEALTRKASKTTVFTTMDEGVPRITRIEIAGETVAHLF